VLVVRALIAVLQKRDCFFEAVQTPNILVPLHGLVMPSTTFVAARDLDARKVEMRGTHEDGL
jgi:hypothetical protein